MNEIAASNIRVIRWGSDKFIDGEAEAFVTFRAVFGGGEMVEKSRFLREDGVWLYVSGDVLS